MDVPIYDAKNRLSALLAEVARGGEVTITKRGVAVARPVPAFPTFDRDKARRAASGLRGEPWRYAGRHSHQGSGGRRPALSFVLDHPVALAWCFEDEQTPSIKALLDAALLHAAAALGIETLGPDRR